MPQYAPDIELEYAVRHREMLELHLTGTPVAAAVQQIPVSSVTQQDPYSVAAGPTPNGTHEAQVVLPVDLNELKYPLAALADLSLVVDEIDRMRRNLVQECRRRERSWADIAAALGVTRQSAWGRYSADDE